jgi:hypothetical protein
VRLVRDIEELYALAAHPRVNGLWSRAPQRLANPRVSQSPLIRAQARFDRLQKRCGCAAAGVVTLVALIGAGVHQARAFEGLSARFAGACVLLFLGSLTLGFMAKIAVLAFTRVQFAYECRALARVLAWGEKQDVDVHALGR